MCGFITGAFGVCAERGPTFLPARLAGAPLPPGFAASGPGDFLTVCLSPSNTGTWTSLSRNPAHLDFEPQGSSSALPCVKAL